jgi:cell surface protein SprA
MSTIGFGSIDQTVNERNKFSQQRYGVQTNVQLDKFLPAEAGVRIPMFFSFSEDFKTPQFNPLDPDIPFKQALANVDSKSERDSLRYAGQEYEMRKSINFTNVGKNKSTGGASPAALGGRNPKAPPVEKDKKGGINLANTPLAISNFNTSYAFTESEERNINIVRDHRIMHSARINYSYQTRPKNIQPFKNAVKNKQLSLIKDFNFYYLPKQVSLSTELKRNLATLQMRNTFDPNIQLPVTYNKALTSKRMYDVAYDLSKGLRLDYNATAQSRVDELPGNPKTQANRDTIAAGLRNLGRPTQFHQTVNVNWQIPLNKLPYMDFTSTSLRYSANYDWQSNSLSALNPKANPDIYYGSTAQNSNSIQFNGNANFVNFYNQVPFLRKANQGGNAKPQARRRGAAEPIVRGKPAANSREDRKNDDDEKEPSKVLLGAARMAMMVRSASLTYSQTNGTLLPGVITNPVYLGTDPSSMFAPGFGFVFGSQQDVTQKAAANGWLTTNPKQPSPLQKTFTDNLNFRAVVEPWNDIRLQITATKVSGWNSQSIFRYHDPLIDTTLGLPAGFYNFNPMEMGNYSISFLSWGSAFEPLDSNFSSSSYDQFLSNRNAISNRLALLRAAGDPTYIPSFIDAASDTTGTREGYDGFSYNSQDVLVPAFLAAYSGQDPNSVALNGRPALPMPNWNLNFNGLMRIPWFKKNFQSFSLTHNYKSTYTINQYQTNLLLQQRIQNGEPANAIRNTNGDFLGDYQISQISIAENFGPFVGLNMRLKNQASFRLDMKRNRNLNLSLVNNQLTETKGYEVVIGTGYIIRDVSMTIVSDGRPQKITSNLDIKVDFSLRDNQTVIRRILEDIDQVTAGQRIWSIKASADYMLSSKLTARLYYDQTASTFKTSNAFPTMNISGGIAFRFNLGN